MVSTIFHDENDTQMKIFVNTNNNLVIEVGNLFGSIEESMLIIIEDADIDALIKEIERCKEEIKLL